MFGIAAKGVKTTKIRFLTSISGINARGVAQAFYRDDVADWESAEAKRFCELGYATEDLATSASVGLEQLAKALGSKN